MLRLVHNTTLNDALRCFVYAWTLVEMQHNARIDSDPILVFPCIAFLCLVIKKPLTFFVLNLCVSQINATQDLASLCEPALSHGILVQVGHTPPRFGLYTSYTTSGLQPSVV